MPDQMSVQRGDDGNKLDLSINLDQLDVDWASQPNQMWVWSQHAADAQLVVDDMKAALALTEAELDKLIRDAPGDFGINKLNNDIVKYTIIRQKDYKDAVSDLNKAKHRAAIIDAAVSGLVDKKRALTKITDLQISVYYSEMRHAGGGGSRFMDDSEKEDVRQRGMRHKRHLEREKIVDDREIDLEERE